MDMIPKVVFTKEFKEEAVKLVIEGGLSITEAARRLSIPKSTLDYWVKKLRAGKPIESLRKHKPVDNEKMELTRLKRELAEVKMERDILKKAVAYFAKESLMKYAFIKNMRLIYPLPVMCRVLSVSKSGYYAWLIRPPSKRKIEEARLSLEIKLAHNRTRGTYGPYRLQKELLSHGIRVGILRIRRIRKNLGIRCRQIKRYKVTTDSKHRLPVANNLLEKRFDVTSPNKIWTSDITYIPTYEGWLYCATHKDLYNGEIVGYALDSRLTKELVIKSLLMAVRIRKPQPGLIHHSDRGIQYCSHEYGKLLKHLGIKPSMSGKGNCYDNAPMESFFGTLKNELIHHRRYATREDTIKDITEYIEVFYNRQRIQKRLGYLSPANYLKQFYMMRQVV